MDTDPVNLPFATMPKNLYIRTEARDRADQEPTELFKALTESDDPNAWTKGEVLGPLRDKLRMAFDGADVVRRFDGSDVVTKDELVPITGTDKPAVLGKDGEPVMFSRVCTPRFVKDLAEMSLAPQKLDCLIAEAGEDLAREVARMLYHYLKEQAKLTELYDGDELATQPELTSGDYILFGHPHVFEDEDAFEDSEHDTCPFDDAHRFELYAIPRSAIITYRRLTEPDVWIKRDAYMVEVSCHMIVGARMSNLKGLRRFTWGPRSVHR
jgi:hypothetical protein